MSNKYIVHDPVGDENSKHSYQYSYEFCKITEIRSSGEVSLGVCKHGLSKELTSMEVADIEWWLESEAMRKEAEEL